MMQLLELQFYVEGQNGQKKGFFTLALVESPAGVKTAKEGHFQ